VRLSERQILLRRARILTWNGKDLPVELCDLRAGRYVVEAALRSRGSLASSLASYAPTMAPSIVGKMLVALVATWDTGPPPCGRSSDCPAIRMI
jgi:hypothetical protein